MTASVPPVNAGSSRCSRSIPAPVGFQNSATGPDMGFYAARSYSLMRPPRTSRHLIRCREKSAMRPSAAVPGVRLSLHSKQKTSKIFLETQSTKPGDCLDLAPQPDPKIVCEGFCAATGSSSSRHRSARDPCPGRGGRIAGKPPGPGPGCGWPACGVAWVARGGPAARACNGVASSPCRRLPFQAKEAAGGRLPDAAGGAPESRPGIVVLSGR